MTAQDIGEIRKEFRPGLENLIAGVIICLLLIGAGCGLIYLAITGIVAHRADLPLYAEKGWSWATVAGVSALGLGLIVGACFAIRWLRSLSALRVVVGQNGFAVSQPNAKQVFLWEDILSVQETQLCERAPIVKVWSKYLSPRIKSRSFMVRRKQGEPFAFNGNSIKGHIELADMIQEETDSRNIPWEFVEEFA